MMTGVTGNWTCDGNIHRPSCYLSPTEQGELDAVAAIRIIISCLSLIGALSIIYSTIRKREFFNHKVHPIFILSIADTMLALLYIIGGIVWLRQESAITSRVWCFAAYLPTIILQCVTVNLTVLYALLAYSGVKKRHTGDLLVQTPLNEHVWSSFRTTLSYIVAWMLPIVIVMLLFTAVTSGTQLLHRVEDCSCWCRPSLGNVIPYAHNRDIDTMEYRRDMRILIISIASVISAHFTVGFIILVVVYRLMLKTIHKMRATPTIRWYIVSTCPYKVYNESCKTTYGTMECTVRDVALENVETRAKRRVSYFLIAFMVSGFFNILLCNELMLIDVVRLIQGETLDTVIYTNHQNWMHKLFYITLCLQSVTITQQGFLNAIVYGWTREDFLNIMVINTQDKIDDSSASEVEEEEEEERGELKGRSHRQNSMKHSNFRDEHSFNYSTDVSDWET